MHHIITYVYLRRGHDEVLEKRERLEQRSRNDLNVAMSEGVQAVRDEEIEIETGEGQCARVVGCPNWHGECRNRHHAFRERQSKTCKESMVKSSDRGQSSG